MFGYFKEKLFGSTEPTTTLTASKPKSPYDAVVIAPGTKDVGNETGSAYLRIEAEAKALGLPVIKVPGVGALPQRDIEMTDNLFDVNTGTFNTHVSQRDTSQMFGSTYAMMTGLGKNGVDSRANELTNLVNDNISTGALPPKPKLFGFSHSRGGTMLNQFGSQNPHVSLTHTAHDPVPGPFYKTDKVASGDRTVIEATATHTPGFAPDLPLYPNSTVLPVHSRHSAAIHPRPGNQTEKMMQDDVVSLVKSQITGDTAAEKMLQHKFRAEHRARMKDLPSQTAHAEPRENFSGFSTDTVATVRQERVQQYLDDIRSSAKESTSTSTESHTTTNTTTPTLTMK